MNRGFRKVLVVEDEPGLIHVMKLILKSEGYKVIACENGTDALQKIKTVSDIDLIITDVRLPGINGMELLKKSLKLNPQINIIVMSAYSSIELAVEAMRNGAKDFISKPFKKDILILTIKRVEENFELLRENSELRDRLLNSTPFVKIIGSSKVIKDLEKRIRKISKFSSSVLITGESGTGKELVARKIHENSNLSGGFVPVNCGAIAENLLESELFGHVKGAFTGAIKDKSGLFKEADNGTIFLDEIGDLPLNLQVKLLRVLQENCIRPVGSEKEISLNVRVLSATSKDLSVMVKKGEFREDLFYRLNVVPINIPSLRDRKDDIPDLVNYFLNRACKKFKINQKKISEDALNKLHDYDWPGNIRELENTIERLVILSDNNMITITDLPEVIVFPDSIKNSIPNDSVSIKKGIKILEKELIKKALVKCGGRKGKAAELLEISKRALLYKIKEYKILEDSK